MSSCVANQETLLEQCPTFSKSGHRAPALFPGILNRDIELPNNPNYIVALPSPEFLCGGHQSVQSNQSGSEVTIGIREGDSTPVPDTYIPGHVIIGWAGN